MLFIVQYFQTTEQGNNMKWKITEQNTNNKKWIATVGKYKNKNEHVEANPALRKMVAT